MGLSLRGGEAVICHESSGEILDLAVEFPLLWILFTTAFCNMREGGRERHAN